MEALFESVGQRGQSWSRVELIESSSDPVSLSNSPLVGLADLFAVDANPELGRSSDSSKLRLLGCMDPPAKLVLHGVQGSSKVSLFRGLSRKFHSAMLELVDRGRCILFDAGLLFGLASQLRAISVELLQRVPLSACRIQDAKSALEPWHLVTQLTKSLSSRTEFLTQSCEFLCTHCAKPVAHVEETLVQPFDPDCYVRALPLDEHEVLADPPRYRFAQGLIASDPVDT